MSPLRDYQEAAHQTILQKLSESDSTLLPLPTGAGKTRIFSEVIRSFQPLRTLVFEQQRQLVRQTAAAIEKWTGLHCEVEMADEYAHTDLWHKMPVVVTTRQSQTSGGFNGKRYTRFKPTDFGLLICDEAHNTRCDSYEETIDYYRRGNPNIKICGCTATPNRRDRKALGHIFKTEAIWLPNGKGGFRPFDIMDAVEGGWLVEPIVHFIPVEGLDLSNIHIVKGDLCEGELQSEMERDSNIMGMIQPSLEIIFGLKTHTLKVIPPSDWKAYLADVLNKRSDLPLSPDPPHSPRRTIVFTASVEQAMRMSDKFNEAFPGISDWIHAKTPDDKREKILGRYASGEVPVICNCNILGEGSDFPATEVIVMAKPTTSHARYQQWAGRGFRPLPGIVDGPRTAQERIQSIRSSMKPRLRIVDFKGNSGEHNLVCGLDILGGKMDGEVKKRAMAIMISEARPRTVCKVISEAESFIEKEKAEERKRAMESAKARWLSRSKFKVIDVNPFGHVKKTLQFKAGTQKKPISEPQRWYLHYRGIEARDWSASKAGWAIGKIKANGGELPKNLEFLRK